jgi:integrase
LILICQKLKVNELERYRAERLTKGVKPITLNRDRAALPSLTNCAVEAEIIPVNPIIKFKKLKEVKDERTRWLGQHDKDEDIKDDDGNKIGERERFMVAIEAAPDYLRVMVLLAMNTGMRRGEIFQLIWESVDLIGGEVVVRAQRLSRPVEIAAESGRSTINRH